MGILKAATCVMPVLSCSLPFDCSFHSSHHRSLSLHTTWAWCAAVWCPWVWERGAGGGGCCWDTEDYCIYRQGRREVKWLGGRLYIITDSARGRRKLCFHFAVFTWRPQNPPRHLFLYAMLCRARILTRTEQITFGDEAKPIKTCKRYVHARLFWVALPYCAL